ncbi:MAG TPA: glucose 1-dehydrogenase [Acidimicrobiia bacterium]|nr:glucose 1-dehydrogenase [Acidimicrobiia bacterium]
MGRLDGKVALVTGAASGLGAATAERFVAEGASVMLVDVALDAARVAADELGAAAGALALDVTEEEQWPDAVDATVAAFGSLTVLVNCAGITGMTPLEGPVEDFRRMMDVNFFGTLLAIRAVIAPMRSAGGGSIVNFSSINGIAGAAATGAYVSSKFAVRGLTKTAALELGPSGIRVNSVHPGAIETPMTSEAKLGFDPKPYLARLATLGRVGQPDEIAQMTTFLASDESSFCTGAEFVIDGGVLAGIPMP